MLVGSALHGFDRGLQGPYRLFHYHSACPGPKHLGCPEVEGWVIARQDREAGCTSRCRPTWGPLADRSPPTENTLHAGARSVASASVVWIYGGPSVKNIPLRTRAWFAGDAFNEGFNGAWRYFKVI